MLHEIFFCILSVLHLNVKLSFTNLYLNQNKVFTFSLQAFSTESLLTYCHNSDTHAHVHAHSFPLTYSHTHTHTHTHTQFVYIKQILSLLLWATVLYCSSPQIFIDTACWWLFWFNASIYLHIPYTHSANLLPCILFESFQRSQCWKAD
jgi:hypothetical protein